MKYIVTAWQRMISDLKPLKFPFEDETMSIKKVFEIAKQKLNDYVSNSNIKGYEIEGVDLWEMQPNDTYKRILGWNNYL